MRVSKGFRESSLDPVVSVAVLRAPCFDGSVFVGVLRIQKWGRVLVLAASRECSACCTQKVNPLPNSWRRCSKGLENGYGRPCWKLAFQFLVPTLSSCYDIVKCCILPVVISRNPVVITVAIAKNIAFTVKLACSAPLISMLVRELTSVVVFGCGTQYGKVKGCVRFCDVAGNVLCFVLGLFIWLWFLFWLSLVAFLMFPVGIHLKGLVAC